MAQNRVLITGSSRGLGRAMALALAADGYAVTINGRSESEALSHTHQLIEEAGGSVRQLITDVTDRDATRQALEADMEAHGAYYGVVVNAGLQGSQNATDAIVHE